jgi:uncharacterized protein
MANWHSFRALGRYFLLDVPSNSLFVVDHSVHQYLTGYPVSDRVREQIDSDLAELRSAGYLSAHPEEPVELNREPILKALCLHVSHDCNLRCGYCFAGTGPFGGAREQMSAAVGKKAVDLLLDQSGKRRQLEVDFFGGEPLLNLGVVKEVIEYGRDRASGLGKEIHFTLTTNGIALDEAVQDFLNEYQLALVLSLDGRAEVNDRMRGQGVYQRIVPKFQRLVESRGHRNYYLRGTYTANNLDFANDVRHLYDLGFRELSLEPVVDKDGDYRLTEEHLERIGAEYEKLAEFYLERQRAGAGFTFFHFEVSLEHGPCLPKRLTGCGAGFDYFAVTPTGVLYPCHQFVGREAFAMGDVNRGIVRDDLRREFGAATLYRKKGCAECWARFYCSGGCHANAHLFNGSIYEPDELGCKLQRKRIECALALKGIESELAMESENA